MFPKQISLYRSHLTNIPPSLRIVTDNITAHTEPGDPPPTRPTDQEKGPTITQHNINLFATDNIKVHNSHNAPQNPPTPSTPLHFDDATDNNTSMERPVSATATQLLTDADQEEFLHIDKSFDMYTAPTVLHVPMNRLPMLGLILSEAPPGASQVFVKTVKKVQR